MRMPTFGKMLRFIITIGLLVFVFWQSGLFSAEGRRHFLELIAQADLVFLVASFVMPSCLDFVSSVKWFLLAKGIQIEARIGQLFAYYLMGRFFNLVLPSNIGGDIIRIHLHGKKSGKRAQSAAAVFMERFTGLVALLLIVLVVAVVQSTSIDIPFMGVAILFTAVVTLVAAWVIVDERLFKTVRQFAVKIWPKFDLILSKIDKFRSSVLLYRSTPSSLIWSMIYSFAFYALAIVYAWIAVSAFSPATSLSSMAIAVPLIMVMMNLPISIGSIGLMEFSYTVILGFVGVSAEAALATALLMRIHTFVSAGLGGVLYSLRHDKSAEELLHNPTSSLKEESVR